ncbi:GGDEF domain-containing protein [Dyella psychrodurans]|uniref:GGDEF domain-containing protein n=1 Tax=Dyella psychrodurans TaxID=1927960 RepID=A0A370WWI1_9GAMM|nr:GGDEF domain-containing protein [Dyella psychrodurans]RDS80377.1 GGDEF domain-containing protein [Dyella psychrodurans]
MSWKELPDLLAVGVLIYAFVSVARPAGSRMTQAWLAGWICVEVHFAAYSFLDLPGVGGMLADIVGTSSLIWCAQLFCWSVDPRSERWGSRVLFGAVSAVYTLYIVLATLPSVSPAVMVPAALLFALVPLTVVAATPAAKRPFSRWITVGLNTALSIALLGWQFSKHGPDLMEVMPLFVAYFTCCVQFWFSNQRRTGGFVVTILGLLAWSLVFPVGMAFDVFLPNVQVGAEVWNLPKYLVAIGMILLLLETQLRRNQHLAHHDSLTGLPNRRLFKDRISGALERARQRNIPTAVLAIDLDGFKEVNDTLGHHAGDDVLQQVARLFAAYLRRVDTVARTGGDEFSVVLEGPIGRHEAIDVASTLKELLEAPLSVAGRTMQIGASIGLAMFPDDAQTPEELSILADERMYTAKRNGGGRVQAD